MDELTSISVTNPDGKSKGLLEQKRSPKAPEEMETLKKEQEKIAVKKSYHVHLWDQFDVVVERLQQGRTELKMGHSFFENLASVELQYARGLAKVAAIGKAFTTKSSVEQCFSQAKTFMKGVVKLHENTATDISQHLTAKISSLIDEIKEQVIKDQHNHASVTKELTSLEMSYKRKKSRFEDAVQKHTHSVTALNEARNSGRPVREIQKLAVHQEKYRKNLDVHQEKLRTGVLQLAAQQNLLRTETERMLRELEVLDRRRAETFKDMMCFYRKLLSDIAAYESQGAKIQQKTITKLTLEKDIQDFITSNETRKAHEPVITMEMATVDIEMNSARIDEESLLSVDSNIQRHITLSDQLGMSSGGNSDAELEIELDSAKLSDRIAVALYNYKGEEKGGFSFSVGDQFDIVDAPEGEAWWSGTHRGKTGRFPAGLVRLQNSKVAPIMIHKELEAAFDFDADHDDEISLVKGDIVNVVMVFEGWCLGNVKTRYGIPENSKYGLFPYEFLNEHENSQHHD